MKKIFAAFLIPVLVSLPSTAIAQWQIGHRSFYHPSGGGGHTVTFVSTAQGGGATMTPGAAVVAGDFLVAAIYDSNSGVITAVSSGADSFAIGSTNTNLANLQFVWLIGATVTGTVNYSITGSTGTPFWVIIQYRPSAGATITADQQGLSGNHPSAAITPSAGYDVTFGGTHDGVDGCTAGTIGGVAAQEFIVNNNAADCIYSTIYTTSPGSITATDGHTTETTSIMDFLVN